MDSEIKEDYIKAGKIGAKVRKESESLIKPGASLLDIAEKIEASIKKMGGEIGFPVNLSMNEIAAHYTPTLGDETKVPENAIVKIDVGVHVNGYLADTATTVCLDDNYKKLAESTEKALEEAIKILKPGIKISEISEKIEKTIKSFDYNPISNLMGHGLDKYMLHSDPTIPNISNNMDFKLKKGMAIAIEPFATDGDGFIRDSGQSLIFMLIDKKPVRNPDSKKILEFAEQFRGLPFAERWIPFDSLFKIRLALRELKEREIIYEYPPLKEKGMVSQHEHTIIIDDEPIITTL